MVLSSPPFFQGFSCFFALRFSKAASVFSGPPRISSLGPHVFKGLLNNLRFFCFLPWLFFAAGPLLPLLNFFEKLLEKRTCLRWGKHTFSMVFLLRARFLALGLSSGPGGVLLQLFPEPTISRTIFRTFAVGILAAPPSTT